MMQDTEPVKRKVGVFSLLVLAFFWVNGGCYGNEALLQAGPPATVFLLLTITPFIYSVPLALIAVELTTAMPMEGGMASWVQVAFGNVVGGHNTYWIFVSYLVDSSVYPVLAGEYLVDELAAAGLLGQLDRERGTSLVASLIVMLVFAIKMLGTDWLVRFSTVVAACALLPVVIFVLAGLRKLQPADWVVTSHPLPIDWALMLSWQLWLYSGFMGLGTLAAELESPRRAMLLVIAMLIPLILCVNNLPLMISLGIDDNIANYEPGYFDILANKLVGGEWLGWMMTVGAQVVMIGLHNACTAVCERSVSQFVNSRVSRASLVRLQQRPGVVGWLFDPSKHGVAPIFICFSSGMNMLLVWSPYKLLVNMGMLLICFPVMLLCASFVWFRVKQPDMPRSFRVPGNTAVAALVAILPCCMTGANLYFIITDAEPVFGVLHINVYISFALVALGILVHLVYWRFFDRSSGYAAQTYKQRLGLTDESTPLLGTEPDSSRRTNIHGDEEGIHNLAGESSRVGGCGSGNGFANFNSDNYVTGQEKLARGTGYVNPGYEGGGGRRNNSRNNNDNGSNSSSSSSSNNDDSNNRAEGRTGEQDEEEKPGGVPDVAEEHGDGLSLSSLSSVEEPRVQLTLGQIILGKSPARLDGDGDRAHERGLAVTPDTRDGSPFPTTTTTSFA